LQAKKEGTANIFKGTANEKPIQRWSPTRRLGGRICKFYTLLRAKAEGTKRPPTPGKPLPGRERQINVKGSNRTSVFRPKTTEVDDHSFWPRTKEERKYFGWAGVDSDGAKAQKNRKGKVTYLVEDGETKQDKKKKKELTSFPRTGGRNTLPPLSLEGRERRFLPAPLD